MKFNVLRCLLLVAVITADAGSSFAQESRIRVGFSAMSGSMAWLWAAKEGGYFDQQGLKVDLVYIGGTAQLFQALLAGEIAFGIGGGPALINANVQRRTIVGVAGTLNRMVMKIMATPQIKSPNDLRGKRIAITRYGTTTDFSARLFLKNWAPAVEKEAIILQVGSVPNVLASLQSGTSQLGALSPPAHLQAERAGFTELMDLSQREIFYPYTYVTVSVPFLETNSILIRPFLAGVIQGVHRFKTDKAFAKRQIAKYLRVNDDRVLGETHALFADLLENSPYIKREGMAALTKILAETDPMLGSFQVESIIEDRFVRELEKSGFVKKLYR
jgi:NitT/TauT family transport system substrate-binding protein